MAPPGRESPISALGKATRLEKAVRRQPSEPSLECFAPWGPDTFSRALLQPQRLASVGGASMGKTGQLA